MTVLRALEDRITTISVQGKQGTHSSTYGALANAVPGDSIPQPQPPLVTGKEILPGTKSAQTKW